MQQMISESALSYSTFTEEIMDKVKDLMGEEFDVKIYKVTKNNSLELDSLVIMKKGGNYTPNIYLLSYFEAYLQGVGVDELAQRIVHVYHNYTYPILNEKFSYTYEEIKAFVTYRLVSFHKNRKLLEKIPYVKYLDLAITFHCLVRDDSDGIGTIRITNEHIQHWGVTKQQLLDLAILNTRNLFPHSIKSMEEVIYGMIKEEYKSRPEDSLPEIVDTCFENFSSSKEHRMYILTNQKGINGATCLLYDHVLKEFAEKIQTDLYILPSSIHEVILIPYSNSLSKETLSDMVMDVNRTQVARDEVLSDRIYFYSRKKDSLSM